MSVSWASATDPSEPPRVGYAIGKVVGGAVTRNLVRRRLQAALRPLVVDLGPGTYLVGAGPASATATYDELAGALATALAALPAPAGLPSGSRSTGDRRPAVVA